MLPLKSKQAAFDKNKKDKQTRSHYRFKASK